VKIGVLTSGGDVPGLNACIRAIVEDAEERGWTVIGLRRGWHGLLHYNPDDPESGEELVLPLSKTSVIGIENKGGTILHTARVNPKRMAKQDVPDFLQHKARFDMSTDRYDCTEHVLSVLALLEIDALIPIGGDGSLRFAAHLHDSGFPIVSVPKTMDNDVFGTDYCIGFSTCVTRSVDSVNTIRTSADSHERIGIIELFGRHSGEPALISGYVASADRVLIPEVPFDLARFAEQIRQDREDNPRNYSLAVVAEGAFPEGGSIVYEGGKDMTGQSRLGGVARLIAAELRQAYGFDVFTQSLAYLLRSGEPDALDKLVASSFGHMAIQLIARKQTGFMTSIKDGNYAIVDAGTCMQGTKTVDVEQMYDTQAYRPRLKDVLGMPMFLY